MSLQPPQIRSICLYCGSSNQVDRAYLEAATAFGQSVAKAGLRLVYGGGGVGLMGAAARAARDAGGEVLGIMPKFLRNREGQLEGVENVIVQSMHERKMMMFEHSDAFAVAPGGIGTLEEVIELLSWRRLDLHQKPTAFINVNRFWDPLFALIDHTIATKFSPGDFSTYYFSVDAAEDVVKTLTANQGTQKTA